MRKVLAIAGSEYRRVVLTKSFLLSLLFPVFIYGGMFAASIIFGGQTDLRDRTCVVVDRTGVLLPGLLEANETRNRSDDVIQEGGQVGPRFVIEPFSPSTVSDPKDLLIELSNRVREGDIFAFAIIGEDYLGVEGGENDTFQYFSESPTFNRLPDWLSRTVRQLVEEKRFAEAGYDPKEINLLTSHNYLERFNLAELDEEGDLIEPKEENEVAAFLIPFGLVLLIFISIQMTTPVLLNSIIDEKMQRITEVLLSSVTPFQLLLGKTFAGVSVGLTFSAVYIASLSMSLRYFEKVQWIPQGTFFWFFIFLLVGMLTFGSMFAGVSAACQDLKDSQNFAGTIILVLIVPLVLSIVAIESPDGPFATILSLVPPFSVMAMMNRIAIPPGPPEWQIFLSVGLNLVFATLIAWASSRVFRIGILAQGTAPTWRELIRWIFRRG